jgi:hypothetical protein
MKKYGLQEKRIKPLHNPLKKSKRPKKKKQPRSLQDRRQQSPLLAVNRSSSTSPRRRARSSRVSAGLSVTELAKSFHGSRPPMFVCRSLLARCVPIHSSPLRPTFLPAASSYSPANESSPRPVLLLVLTHPPVRISSVNSSFSLFVSVRASRLTPPAIPCAASSPIRYLHQVNCLAPNFFSS